MRAWALNAHVDIQQVDNAIYRKPYYLYNTTLLGGVFVILAFRVKWRWHTIPTISATTGT
jgi:hypothetical protein